MHLLLVFDIEEKKKWVHINHYIVVVLLVSSKIM